MTQLITKNSLPITRLKTSGNSEAIKVIVRCRPLSEAEIKEGHQSIVSIDSNRGVIEIKNPKDLNEPPKTFTFDAIYNWNSTQSELYDETFRDLVNSVLNGFNGTIFAYGQTGTGKTFTMEGIHNDKTLRGVIPNSFEHIFQHIAMSTQQQYLVRASYLEIYQEEIRDLLNKDCQIRLELKERPDIGVYVKDLSSFVVKSVQEIQHVMSVGHANRSVGRTNMNEHSSRSHAIFIITIECSEVGPDGENHIRVGRLNLVDLAGSERQSKTGTLGERFKEATKINLSLSALGNVISALVDGKSSHIPYRDSKLTRLLQDSLGGNSKTIMVANIGPASYNFEETIGTLRYANRAKNIKNKPRINEDPKDALVREFQEEIARLKSMLEKRSISSSRKRRSKKHNTMSDSTDSNVLDQSNTLEYLEEQQRILEKEQKEINDNTSIISEEKQKLLADLNRRKEELMKEREAQQNLTDRIQAIQSKLLSGNSSLFDKTRKQENELENKRLEIAEQRKREREILQQLELQECSTSEINQTFTNLKQEVELKTKKLKKLYLKYQQIRSELQDISFQHSRERQDLETSVSEITKELKLKLLIVDNFIPNDVVRKLKERAYFDDDSDEWHILKSGYVRPKTTEYSNDSQLFNASLNPEDEKPSLFIDKDDCIILKNKNDGETNLKKFVQTLVLRPSSRPEQRRSFTIYEQQLLNKARQRIQKSSCVKPTLFANEENLVEEIIPEEVLRICGENILTFSCLETFPSIVKNYDITSLSHSNKIALSNNLKSTYDSNIKTNCDVMIDVSRIPAPRRAVSRDSRKDYKNNRIQYLTTVPKKGDARSVQHSSQPTTAMANISSNTSALVYPKALVDNFNLLTTSIKCFKKSDLLYDSALSSLNDLTSFNNIDICLESNKSTTKVPNIQSQSFNRLISSFTTPKQSKIPVLLSQSMSECHKSKNEHFKSVLLQSSYNSNSEISLGSCEQLTEIHLSPRIEAENLLKACKRKKPIPCTKYSKPSLLSPLKRDIPYYNNINFKNNLTNSSYFNEQSSGLGSSIITMQSFIDESEEKEIKSNVDKYMSFTKMRHSLKIYRNQMGGFDEDYYKKPNWLFLSSRGFCRMCKHIPDFLISYKKIRKKNVVKRRPCICKKLQPTNNITFNKIHSQILSNNIDKEILLNFETLILQGYFLILLIPGAIAFLIETLLFII